MKSAKLRTFFCVGLLLAVTTTGVFGIGEARAHDKSAKSMATGEPESLEECLSAKGRLAVLWLIDQSRSLRKTDPYLLRRTPLNATLRLLNLTANSESDRQLQIQGAVAGFGDGATVTQDWIEVNQQTIGTLETTLSETAAQTEDNFTQYQEALGSATKLFRSLAVADSCRVMFWFSDGEHDHDDSPNRVTPKEQRQIREEICGAGGLADQVRNERIFTIAIGLASEEEDIPLDQLSNRLQLLNLIATNEGEYQVSDSNFSLSSCGLTAPFGKFVFGTDSDALTEIFDIPPFDGEGPDVPLAPCESGEAECAEVSFEADEALSGFSMTLTRAGSTTASLQLPGTEEIDLFPSTAGLQGIIKDIISGPVTVVRLSENRVVIKARRTTSTNLEGTWTVSFRGPNSGASNYRIAFEGDVDVSAVGAEDEVLEIIERYDTKALRIRVDEGTVVTAIAAEIGDGRLSDDGKPGRTFKLPTPIFDDGAFVIQGYEIEQFLQNELADAASARIAIVPEGVIKFLRYENGSPIPIDFQPTTLELGISNGDGYPTYLGVSENIEIKETDQFAIQIRFRGANAANSKAKFEGFDEFPNSQGFEIREAKECVIPPRIDTTCEFVFKPQKSGYGQIQLPLKISLNSDKAARGRIEQTVRLDAFMTRDPNVGKGVTNGLLLIVGFLLIQVLIRLLTALALSRFERLDSTARRVRIPIRVSLDGNISGRDGAGIRVAPSGSPDNAFAVEMSERQRTFDIFSYEFESSVVKVFLRTMARPVGEVTLPGSHVFGSAGSSIPSSRRLAGKFAKGRVDLTLRRQWIISVSGSGLSDLANGEIDGELVAILDPIEIVSADEQLSDLQMAISASQFGSDLGIIYQRVVDSDREDDSTPEEASDTFEFDVGISDPFGGSPSESPGIVRSNVQTSKSKSRRADRKTRRDADASSTFTDAPMFDPDDPFS